MNFSYRTLFRTVTDQKMDEMVVNGDELGLCKDSFMVSQPSLWFREKSFLLATKSRQAFNSQSCLTSAYWTRIIGVYHYSAREKKS